ncbi:MAG: hypothetical protein DHS80DRAFT_31886 [Piptocephalis tieghemiana]|nr:MAG: hypothetical protein DHS80DRAFT_31886 [Piptocephalis tieghemiana]
MDFIPPNHLTERSPHKNTVYIHTRDCKLSPKLILTYIIDFFDEDMEAFRYTRNKGRFEVSLWPGVNPAKYIYQSIPVGNMALKVEKVYRADENLAIMRLSDLPIRSAETLIKLIQEHFSKPFKVLEIMIGVAGRIHCPSGTATVILDISDDPESLRFLPKKT